MPCSLQSLTFGSHFDQSLENVTLPCSLQSLTFGICFNQSLENVTLPSSLQSLSTLCLQTFNCAVLLVFGKWTAPITDRSKFAAIECKKEGVSDRPKICEACKLFFLFFPAQYGFRGGAGRADLYLSLKLFF